MQPDHARRRGRIVGLLLTALAMGCNRQETPVGPGSNRAPEIRNVLVSPPSVGLGQSASVRVEAQDPDGDPLFFRYAADTGTLTPDPQQPGRATFTNTDPGGRTSARLLVYVSDDKNAQSSFNVNVDLLGNQSPRVQVRAGRVTCHPECTISVTAEAQDAEGDQLEYLWSGCASGAFRSAECRVRHVGPATAIVSVRDARGGVAVGTATVSGTNAAPSVAREGPEQRASPSRLVINPVDADPGDDFLCAWRGDCKCTGDFQSWNVNCELPGGASSCLMTAYCWDDWGGRGDARFRLVR
jgi:hypothetical protein